MTPTAYLRFPGHQPPHVDIDGAGGRAGTRPPRSGCEPPSPRATRRSTPPRPSPDRTGPRHDHWSAPEPAASARPPSTAYPCRHSQYAAVGPATLAPRSGHAHFACAYPPTLLELTQPNSDAKRILRGAGVTHRKLENEERPRGAGGLPVSEGDLNRLKCCLGARSGPISGDLSVLWASSAARYDRLVPPRGAPNGQVPDMGVGRDQRAQVPCGSACGAGAASAAVSRIPGSKLAGVLEDGDGGRSSQCGAARQARPGDAGRRCAGRPAGGRGGFISSCGQPRSGGHAGSRRGRNVHIPIRSR